MQTMNVYSLIATPFDTEQFHVIACNTRGIGVGICNGVYPILR